MAIVVVGFWLGWEAAGGLTALLGGGAAINKAKEKTKEKKKEADMAEQDYNDLKKENDKKIQEAGEDIEKEDINNHSDAADYIDDTLNDISSK